MAIGFLARSSLGTIKIGPLSYLILAVASLMVVQFAIPIYVGLSVLDFLCNAEKGGREI